MIEEKIRQWCAAATVEEAGERVVVVPKGDVAEVCRRLHDDAEEPMDYMRDLVAADGDGRLSVFYLLESTRTGGRVTLRTDTDGREEPFLPSVCRIWKTAEIKEREAYDFFGIRFTGHPDMRRLYLREDWAGYPLLKDYDMGSNPLNMENEVNADVTEEYDLRADGTIERRENVVFNPDDFIVNIGPQHPSTHGVLRMRTSLDGETVKKIDPILGYIHRGIEKMNESLTYPQTLALTFRLD